MGEADFLVALEANWPAVLAELAPSAARRFAELVRELRSAASPDDAAGLLYQLGQLSAKLPPRHPIRVAASRLRYGTGPAVVDLARISAVIGRLDLEFQDLDDPEEWLRAAPSLSEQDVRGYGVAPERTDLIRLPAAGKERPLQLPAFQFGSDGQPVPVVLAVNELLGARDDPWGVADWWLGENAWLDAAPADLIGQVADVVLLQAARAVRWEE